MATIGNAIFASSGTDATGHSYASATWSGGSLNIQAAAADRYPVVGVVTRDNVSGISHSSLTGLLTGQPNITFTKVPSSERIGSTDGGTSFCTSSVWVALAGLDYGTTLDSLDTVYSGTALRAGVTLGVSYGIDPTALDVFTAAGTDVISGNIDVSVGGIGFFISASSQAGATTAAWSGTEVVEVMDEQMGGEAARFTAAVISDAAAAEAGRLITCDWATTIADGVLSGVTWSAAAGGTPTPEPATRRKQNVYGGNTGGMQMRRRASGLYVPERRLLVPGYMLPKRKPAVLRAN